MIIGLNDIRVENFVGSMPGLPSSCTRRPSYNGVVDSLIAAFDLTVENVSTWRYDQSGLIEIHGSNENKIRLLQAIYPNLRGRQLLLLDRDQAHELLLAVLAEPTILAEDYCFETMQYCRTTVVSFRHAQDAIVSRLKASPCN